MVDPVARHPSYIPERVVRGLCGWFAQVEALGTGVSRRGVDGAGVGGAGADGAGADGAGVGGAGVGRRAPAKISSRLR